LTAVHQFLPVLAAGDAIGNHVLRIRRILREAGYDSEVFAADIHPPVRREARSYLDYQPPPAGAPTWFLYHLSTGHSMAAWLGERPEPLAVDYHNITPAEYFDRWFPPGAEVARAARAEMRKLASRSRFALADSIYNAAELDAEGYRHTAVAPILIDFSEYDIPPDAATLGRLRRRAEGGGAHWLFVGRISANKAQHDVIGAFAVYRKLFDPKARLSVVGGRTALLYSRALELLAADLGVADAVDFTDTLSFDRLLAYFATADVFVSLSEHEGFCVPAVEAMHFSVPVVAYAATAVPDTVADAGLLLDDKDPLVVATAVHRVLTDRPLRERLVAAGKARVDHFSFENNRSRLLTAVEAGLAANG
jgi:glycosyltransferase involved in cell wall biosynthesis